MNKEQLIIRQLKLEIPKLKKAELNIIFIPKYNLITNNEFYFILIKYKGNGLIVETYEDITEETINKIELFMKVKFYQPKIRYEIYRGYK